MSDRQGFENPAGLIYNRTMSEKIQQVASPPVFVSKPKPDQPRSSTFFKSRTSSMLPELLILALAALTRFWRLDFHSFWFDEAVSLQWAASDPAYTWDVTLKLVQEKHPPVYYITLHYWQAGLNFLGLGHSDAGLRALGQSVGRTHRPGHDPAWCAGSADDPRPSHRATSGPQPGDGLV